MSNVAYDPMDATDARQWWETELRCNDKMHPGDRAAARSLLDSEARLTAEVKVLRETQELRERPMHRQIHELREALAAANERAEKWRKAHAMHCALLDSGEECDAMTAGGGEPMSEKLPLGHQFARLEIMGKVAEGFPCIHCLGYHEETDEYEYCGQPESAHRAGEKEGGR